MNISVIFLLLVAFLQAQNVMPFRMAKCYRIRQFIQDPISTGVLRSPFCISISRRSSLSGDTNLPRKPLTLDLTGKVAFIAGVADSTGYGWAIAKQLAAAGATIAVGTWPPVHGIFEKSLNSGRFDMDRKLPDGTMMEIQKIYPLDASYDDVESIPEEVKRSKRYERFNKYTISEVAEEVGKQFGRIDFLVHSLANAPEVTKPLLETSRKGYLAANSASAYSLVSMVQKFAPIMNPGSSVISLTYVASNQVIPGYGGGMSSAKAALESDTKTLAWEAGRQYGLRVNTISAGPLKSRAASAIGKDSGKSFIEYAIDYAETNAPLSRPLYSEDVGNAALFLLSPLARAITGMTLYVDNGLSIMGQAIDSASLQR
ncbi:enoyl-acyl carrier reductase ENR [Cardiosporidium cionae]|uniref:Enoyl-acyl carrier reductase ENR n=1 Tax=Cardiosporidium cionae TaxID=476202 RepID=A0ABQ7JAK0_9APIC|nr:enoyl-acyl carrier reductase ENR [Cardiosporidium cionae]|eukprot:KAF8821016.1 enoyl-acyl carrier reductase ENR [Cardiosporidium cionae]